MPKPPTIKQSLTVDFQGTDIFQGSSVFITVTYTGDSNHKVTTDSNITLAINPENTNVEISSYQDDKRKPVIDTTGNKMVMFFIFKINKSQNNSDVVLTFGTNIAGTSTHTITCKQHQYTKQDVDIKSLVPIIIGNTIIEDFSPAPDEQTPDKAINANLHVVIYPRDNKGNVLKHCQIPLHVEGIEYTRLYNGTTKIFPFNEQMYFVNTDGDGNLDIRFFAKKMTDDYARKIVISNTIYDNAIPIQKKALFITENVLPSDGLGAPIITNMDGNEVPPAESNKNATFDAMIPKSALLDTNDCIYIMSDLNNKKPMLCTSDKYGNRNSQDIPFEIPYELFIPSQYNSLYYYVFTPRQDIYRSKNLIFKLGGDPNSYRPPSGNLEMPTILDYSGSQIDDFFIFGIDSLGTGITCVIPVGSTHEAKAGDVVECFIDIITYDPDTGELNINPTLIQSVTVQSADKHIKIPIGSNFLKGFGVDSDGDPTPLYIYYKVNQEKYSQNWQGFLDTVSLDFN
ncbi:hypothetical protein FE392_15630 [Xenorhabdus sp. 12]|uniref:Uncharacterized protein n=1 Tax=Xenorhabdus santafensis TaxID=2582833 RepID=A0ABU4SDD5_9GAMM|nr:hypothetical protein [Xenorhabdus sp. 12]MDX7988741.1 hypothetical protein [Xenorhabdus sp. 12]